MTDKTKSKCKWIVAIASIAIACITTIITVSYNVGSHKTKIDNDILTVNTKIDNYIIIDKEQFINLNKTLMSQSKDIKQLLIKMARVETKLDSFNPFAISTDWISPRWIQL
ncbi:MAG: hypothetical protein KOO65_08515 [Desulfobacterales bacterium]|nr:hypothetical protein [Desulfobacterales bacterium]